MDRVRKWVEEWYSIEEPPGKSSGCGKSAIFC